MRKSIYFAIIALLLINVVLAAADDKKPLQVYGKIYYADRSFAGGVDVKMVDVNGSVIARTSTFEDGNYFFNFPSDYESQEDKIIEQTYILARDDNIYVNTNLGYEVNPTKVYIEAEKKGFVSSRAQAVPGYTERIVNIILATEPVRFEIIPNDPKLYVGNVSTVKVVVYPNGNDLSGLEARYSFGDKISNSEPRAGNCIDNAPYILGGMVFDRNLVFRNGFGSIGSLRNKYMPCTLLEMDIMALESGAADIKITEALATIDLGYERLGNFPTNINGNTLKIEII